MDNRVEISLDSRWGSLSQHRQNLQLFLNQHQLDSQNLHLSQHQPDQRLVYVHGYSSVESQTIVASEINLILMIYCYRVKHFYSVFSDDFENMASCSLTYQASGYRETAQSFTAVDILDRLNESATAAALLIDKRSGGRYFGKVAKTFGLKIQGSIVDYGHKGADAHR